MSAAEVSSAPVLYVWIDNGPWDSLETRPGAEYEELPNGEAQDDAAGPVLVTATILQGGGSRVSQAPYEGLSQNGVNRSLLGRLLKRDGRDVCT